MKFSRRALKFLSVFAFVVAFTPISARAQHYTQTNLVSDLSSKAVHQDGNLVNSWGLTRSSGSPWWVANNGTGTSTLYDGSGDAFPPAGPLVVTIPPPKNAPAGTMSTPTGTVFNFSAGFAVAPNKPAIFLFVTEDGTISGWNPGVDLKNAILMIDNSGKAVYKGATLAVHNGQLFLYVANFKTGEVEIYDANFHRARGLEKVFNQDEGDEDNDDRDDHQGKSGFAPFNIQNIAGNLFVMYAKQKPDKHDEVDGPGLGFVRILSPGGRFLAHLQHGSWFNAPWGLVQAPSDFGAFSHSLLVGNFGSGQIAAFNPVTFEFEGFLKNPDDSIIVINGLWALQFGNGANAGPLNTLFFTAGLNDEADGLFGTLTAVVAEQVGTNR
jgi:uncharacterized protein (TIGR03118 family)